jgi:hypothetical protein
MSGVEVAIDNEEEELIVQQPDQQSKPPKDGSNRAGAEGCAALFLLYEMKQSAVWGNVRRGCVKTMWRGIAQLVAFVVTDV